MQALEDGARPEISSTWPHHIQKIIRVCWAQDPRQRPSFAVVVEALNKATVPEKGVE